MSCCRDEELGVARKEINNHKPMKWVWYLVGVVKLWAWFVVVPKIGFEKLETMLCHDCHDFWLMAKNKSLHQASNTCFCTYLFGPNWLHCQDHACPGSNRKPFMLDLFRDHQGSPY